MHYIINRQDIDGYISIAVTGTTWPGLAHGIGDQIKLKSTLLPQVSIKKVIVEKGTEKHARPNIHNCHFKCACFRNSRSYFQRYWRTERISRHCPRPYISAIVELCSVTSKNPSGTYLHFKLPLVQYRIWGTLTHNHTVVTARFFMILPRGMTNPSAHWHV